MRATVKEAGVCHLQNTFCTVLLRPEMVLTIHLLQIAVDISRPPYDLLEALPFDR